MQHGGGHSTRRWNHTGGNTGGDNNGGGNGDEEDLKTEGDVWRANFKLMIPVDYTFIICTIHGYENL